MKRPLLSLTTVGLSIRDETLVKSMLQVVAGKTASAWTFSDGLDVDLAFCNPQSALVLVLTNRANETGRPHCVALVRDGACAQPLATSIHAPLQVGAFISLLDSVSASAVRDRAAPALAPTPRPTSTLMPMLVDDTSESGDGFAETVRRLAKEHTAGTWRISHAGLDAVLLMPERRVVLSVPLGADAAAALAGNAGCAAPLWLDATDAAHVREAPSTLPLERLLWMVGLHAPRAAQPQWLATARVRLRQWPDFGRVGMVPAHLALSALLAHAPHDAAELAAASGNELADVEAFLGACAASGLLDIEPGPAPTTPAVAPRRVSRLFQRLRGALGIGG